MALRWGICSVGDISLRVTYCILNHLPSEHHKVVSVAARDLSRVKAFAERLSIPKAYDDYKSLADDKEIDVVYIGTLHSEHKRLSLMFLEAGKHVLCEKPCTMNLRELKEVLAKAKEKQLFFMEAMWSRCLPVYKKLGQIVDAKTLGNIKVVNVIVCSNISHLPNRRDPACGGGGLVVLGVYAIQLMTLLFKDKPQKVVASGHLLPTGVDDAVSMTLLFSNGRMGHLTMNISTSPHFHTTIIGTEGTAELPGRPWSPTKIILPSETLEFPLPRHKDPAFSTALLGYEHQAEEVWRCIKQGLLESPLMTHEDSLLVKEILDETRKQLGVVFPADTEED